ncbi:MAG: DUF1295 domain-containing protein [Erysipelotrichales bacterium]|nr:DUF1295 domain-containing protein [Erysipelotrichales bacterium]
MKKINGLSILLISYIIAFALGFFVTYLFKDILHLLLAIFIGNVVATIIIWFVGVLFHTASTYDPYWSVQTLLISVSLLIYTNNWNVGNILFLIILSLWAIRLTYNFILSFNDISYIDWRYKLIKQKTGVFFQIVNLLGICMVPTIIVYLASIPMFLYIIENHQFELSNIIGLAIMLVGTALELIADNNMQEFKKIRKDNTEIINIGLWKYSRHPNYLGEILFWYGVALVFILSSTFELKYWYVIIGTLLNTLLFIFISIPMAENHMKSYKPGFNEYKKKTRMLLPIKK